MPTARTATNDESVVKQRLSMRLTSSLSDSLPLASGRHTIACGSRATRGITSASTGSTRPWGSISAAEPKSGFLRVPNNSSSSLRLPIRSGAWTSCTTVHPTAVGWWNGRTFRMLNVLDDFNRQVLRIETNTSLPALRVIGVLEQLKEVRGLPNMIRVDNGPEFISHRLDAWCKYHKITLAYIQPGKPTQNAFIERLNGSIRRELLNAYVFRTLDEV